MLITVVLIAAFNLASSAPVLLPTADSDVATPDSETICGRELPECANVNVTRYRTAQDIVLSCLATIFACTWVALHTEVYPLKDSKWKKFRDKVLYMIYAILAPEVLVGVAVKEWREAVRHAVEYNWKHHGSKSFVHESQESRFMIL